MSSEKIREYYYDNYMYTIIYNKYIFNIHI